MTYLKNWAEIEQVLADSGASRFNVCRTKDSQGNNNVFMYDKEKSFDENKEICSRLLQRCAGEMLYLFVWKSDSAKTGGCYFTILYESAPQYQPMPQAQVGGLYSGVSGVDMEGLTRDLTARIRNEYDRAEIDRLRKQLEDERKELRNEQREFEKEKVGTIGILVDKFAPYLKAVAGKHLDLPKVAGVDAEEDVQAAKIHAVEETQEDAECTFTDEEADELLMLLARFKRVEPEYIRLLEAVVKMAEENDNTYIMARGMLLR